jgi:hypothetical protein
MIYFWVSINMYLKEYIINFSGIPQWPTNSHEITFIMWNMYVKQQRHVVITDTQTAMGQIKEECILMWVYKYCFETSVLKTFSKTFHILAYSLLSNYKSQAFCHALSTVSEGLTVTLLIAYYKYLNLYETWMFIRVVNTAHQCPNWACICQYTTPELLCVP